MKILFTCIFLVFMGWAVPLAVPAAEGESGEIPATHREAAEMLIALMVQVEECLASCKDAASVQAALPTLRELSAKVHAFKQMQERLPEPTTQDYMAAQDLTPAFNRAWFAIRKHIERLEKDGLFTQELKEALEH